MKRINLKSITESLSYKEMMKIAGGGRGEQLFYLFCCDKIVAFYPGGNWPWTPEYYCDGGYIATGPTGKDECDQAASQAGHYCHCQGGML